MTRMFNPPHPGLTLRDDVLPALGLGVTQAAEQLPTTSATTSQEMRASNALYVERFVRRNVSPKKFAEWMKENPRHFTPERELKYLAASGRPGNGKGDPTDAVAVWLVLTAQAERKVKAFLGATDEGLKWLDSNDTAQFLSLKNLRDRITRKPKKTR